VTHAQSGVPQAHSPLRPAGLDPKGNFQPAIEACSKAGFWFQIKAKVKFHPAGILKYVEDMK